MPLSNDNKKIIILCFVSKGGSRCGSSLLTELQRTHNEIYLESTKPAIGFYEKMGLTRETKASKHMHWKK